jgi:hypothetical protein
LARKTQILSTFVIALVALSIYRPLFMLGFSHDDLVFLLAKNIRNDHIFDFLSHIVLSPNSYNTHYRPLGFFGYFFIMGSLFDANPVVFDIVHAFCFIKLLVVFFQTQR